MSRASRSAEFNHGQQAGEDPIGSAFERVFGQPLGTYKQPPISDEQQRYVDQQESKAQTLAEEREHYY